VKQQCYLATIYLNWVLLVGGLICFVLEHLYVLASAWVLLLPLAMLGYIRAFPSVSQMMSYGRVQDEPARLLNRSQATVWLFTALGCPFCPIVKQRLISLRDQVEFELEEIDVTLRPGLLAAKGIRTVPVVEVGKRRFVGNIISEQLAELISGLCAR
jgi:glutaredoxin